MLLNEMDSSSISKDGSLEAIHGLSVLRESSCLHYLLPDKHDASITDRLRHVRTFQLFQTRTVKFRKSFIPQLLI